MGVVFHGKKNNCCQEELIFVAEIQGVMERGTSVCQGNDPRIPDRFG